MNGHWLLEFSLNNQVWVVSHPFLLPWAWIVRQFFSSSASSRVYVRSRRALGFVLNSSVALSEFAGRMFVGRSSIRGTSTHYLLLVQYVIILSTYVEQFLFAGGPRTSSNVGLTVKSSFHPHCTYSFSMCQLTKREEWGDKICAVLAGKNRATALPRELQWYGCGWC